MFNKNPSTSFNVITGSEEQDKTRQVKTRQDKTTKKQTNKEKEKKHIILSFSIK